MEKMDWNPSFSVGVALLDEQHKQMTNLLISDSEATVHSETISELLTRIAKYVNAHFKAEEELLEKYSYPDLLEQEEQHTAYRLKLFDLCQDTIDHKTSIPEDLLQYLVEWWHNHIMKTDKTYRFFFVERGVT